MHKTVIGDKHVGKSLDDLQKVFKHFFPSNFRHKQNIVDITFSPIMSWKN